jgi:transforming growth factor-beta-induced protein
MNFSRLALALGTAALLSACPATEPEDDAGPAPTDAGPAPTDAGPETDDDAGPETDDDAGPETDDDAGPETDDDAGPETDDDAGPETDDDAGPETDDDAGPGNLAEVAIAAGNFTTLVTALGTADLATTIATGGPFTVLAPTDAAFALLPAGLVAGLDATALGTVLRYHVIGGTVPAATVVGLTDATALTNGTIKIQLDGTTVVLNGTAQVTATDIEASNGLIHVLDGVIFDGPFPGTLVDALSAYPRFSSLVAAVVAANLVDTLNGTGPFTVLAPTNAAFAALVDISGLTQEQLANVLTYHVLPDSVPAATVVGLTQATTVQGSDITIAEAEGVVTLNGTSTVTYTDIVTSNGIIHVIDTVLMPPASN